MIRQLLRFRRSVQEVANSNSQFCGGDESTCPFDRIRKVEVHQVESFLPKSLVQYLTRARHFVPGATGEVLGHSMRFGVCPSDPHSEPVHLIGYHTLFGLCPNTKT